MAIITLPTSFNFSRVSRFSLERRSNVLRARYTGQRQTIIYPYAMWMLEGELREYDGIGAGAIRGFLALLEGQKNTFLLPVPGYIGPSTGYALTNALTNGITAVRAVSIAIDGLSNSVNLFNIGDFFTIQDELKIVTAAVATNGSGQATVSFQPPLRAAVADNIALTIQNPTCLMTASEDDIASWGIAPPVRQTTRFSAIEAI